MKISLGNWWTTTNSLDGELKSLKNKVDHLKALAEDNIADAGTEVIQAGKKRKREFEFWLSNVESKKTEYFRIENELREQGPSRNLKTRIEKESEEVEKLIQQGQFPKGVVLDDHASTRIPLVTTRLLVGQSRAIHVEEILKLLKENGVFAIGVYGIGGVGKTAIVKEIHNRLLDSDIAEQVYWVTASQDCTVEKLLNDIGEVVGLKHFSKKDNERKKALLFRRFTELKNSVLIIDDLWDSHVMEKIGIPLESCGCKIVITTRNLEVCNRLLCQHIIKIDILDKADSWTLFIKKLGELPSDVEDIAVKIVEKCCGLPLALITMGCCMRGITDVCEWKNALNELAASRQDDLEDEVFQVLKFSYDRLKDDKVQNCFLSCALFPEDYMLQEAELVDLWINEGLLDDMENQQARVTKGHVILNRLANACLLELESFSDDDEDRYVWMHDLIREMGIFITREHPLFIPKAGKLLKQLPEEEKWNKDDLVKVSLSHNEITKIPCAMAPVTPNLTVLMLNDNPLKEIPDSFFENMRALKFLNLSDTNIKRVPESVSGLENLRALLLAYCEELIYVPSVAKLTKLRKLDLVGCNKLKRAPMELRRLKSVEKLSYMPWDMSDSIGFNEVIQCLTSLNSFRFCFQDPTAEISFGDKLYDSDKVIWVSRGEYGGNNSIIVVPTTLESLGIFESKMKGSSLGDVFQPLGEAKGLKYIDIEDCRGLEYISGSSETQKGSSLLSNAQLERLHLEELPDLKGIAKLGAPVCFNQLQDLNIWDCPKLKVVVPVQPTQQLLFPDLVDFRVHRCEEAKEIFETIEATVTRPILSLPNLKLLFLSCLPKIKVIFPFTEKLDLPNLEIFRVECCKELEEIFGSNKASPSCNPVRSLPKLDHLELRGLPELSSIYRGTLYCTSLRVCQIAGCPKLTLRRLPGCLTSTEP